MREFKIDDNVICVNNHNQERYLVIGQQYTVCDATVTDDGVKYISVRCLTYTTILYFRAIHFECIVAKRNEIIDNILV